MSSSTHQYILYFVGTLLLVHSGYSSFEFHKISTHYHTDYRLPPMDIILESVIGIILLVIGSIVSIQNQPFLSIANDKHNMIIKNDSKYLRFIEMKDAVQLSEKIGITDYEEYNSRASFIDINQKRKEYNDWLEKE